MARGLPYHKLIGVLIRHSVVLTSNLVQFRALYKFRSATMLDRTIPLPFPTARALIISDFNCPYCYVLNEWIQVLGMGNRVRWIGIEHRPSLPQIGDNSEGEIETLTREVADVHRRAPGIDLRRPKAWISSHEALLLQNALEDEEPELAPAIRSRIFRSYWNEGRSISNQSVLDNILEEFGISRPAPEPEYLAELTHWWAEELDRIPCMLAPTGIAHFGLQDLVAVRSFLNSAIHSSSTGPGCVVPADSEHGCE